MSLGEFQRALFTFVFSWSECVYGLLVAFGGCTGSLSFLSECVYGLSVAFGGCTGSPSFLSECVYGLSVALGGCTGSPSFFSECVSWFLGLLCWLYWVSFCLSECVLFLLVVGG